VRTRWWAVIVGAGLAVVLAGTGGLLLTRHGTPALRPAPAAAVQSGSTVQPGASGPSGAGARPLAAAPQTAPAQAPPPRPAARPVALTIPQIGVRTSLTTLGLTSQGAIAVPSSTKVAGWYTGSPRPGAVGPAIILGHIDSYRGPGVFFRLSVLRPGDLVDVRRSDGSTAAFRVTAVQSYLKDHFPTQAVYGATPDAELRLITCGGAFDSATGHYLSNVVVYATQAA
jgi:sortase (surface protein transpeptidase)